VALHDVSFGVPQGGIKAVIGPNGAGKTTLFNIITGFLTPDRGQIIYRGQAIQGKPAHSVASRGIARTFQLVQLFDHMTVLENVMVGRHRLTRSGLAGGIFRLPAMRREEAEIRAKAWEALEFVGLADRASQPSGFLPLGLKRLLEIARALASEPRLLLLDEPTAGMSPEERQLTRKLIKQLWDQYQLTLVFIEHDMDMVFGIADRIMVLNHGALIADGTPDQIRANKDVITAYLGEEA